MDLKLGRVLGVAICLSSFSCGNDAGGGQLVSTGLPPDQKLSTVTDAESMKACMGLSQGLNALFTASEITRIQCTTLAVPMSVTVSAGTETGDVAKCERLVDACTSGDASQTGSPDTSSFDGHLYKDVNCSKSHATSELMACDATISQYEACLNALFGAWRDTVAAIDCDGLSDVAKYRSATTQKVVPRDYPACVTFLQICPSTDLGFGK